jgi:succinate dehydrogenase/fumarate reductase flavoprotein subunit
MIQPEGLFRRNFLALSLCLPALAESRDAFGGAADAGTYDAVIVGLGAAGAAAAIEAADRGLKVAVLEKQPQAAHCPTTRLSSGIYQCPDKNIDAELLQKYVTATYVNNGRYLLDKGELDPVLTELSGVWAKTAPQTTEWLQSLDPDFRYASDSSYTVSRFLNIWTGTRLKIRSHIATYGKWIDFLHPTFGLPKAKKMNGEALYACLQEGIRKRRNIDVYYGCTARKLIAGDGAVEGAEALDAAGRRLSFRAKKGVVLASGNFVFNEALRSALLPGSCDFPWATAGSPSNTGDGILLGLSAGAGIIGTSVYFDRFAALLTEKINGTRLGVVLDCVGKPGSIIVDNYGRRYISESTLEDSEQHFGFFHEMLTFDMSTLSFPRAPSWLIFDHSFLLKTPIATLGEGSTVNATVPWDQNLTVAVERGWVLAAASVAELAAKISAHPDNHGRISAKALQETLLEFNKGVAQASDPLFDRNPETLAPISTAPFYALPLSIDIPHMAAGLKTAGKRRVLTWDGKPVKGLYAAGEVAPVSRFIHDKGGHLSECLVFGRYVGRVLAGAA